MKIGLDLAEILRISKLDWRDGGKKEKGRRRGGILLCNGLINSVNQSVPQLGMTKESIQTTKIMR